MCCFLEQFLSKFSLNLEEDSCAVMENSEFKDRTVKIKKKFDIKNKGVAITEASDKVWLRKLISLMT